MCQTLNFSVGELEIFIDDDQTSVHYQTMSAGEWREKKKDLFTCTKMYIRNLEFVGLNTFFLSFSIRLKTIA